MTLAHVSEEPWGNYTKADYTPEQWHAACLIHLHDGPPTSKAQCKVPVKTPSGTLSRAGVHAAAAALAGARGGVDAPPGDIAKAKAAVRRHYSTLGDEPPDSLKQSDIAEMGEGFLIHYGVLGMKWGHRKERDPVAGRERREKVYATLSKTAPKAVRVGTTSKDFREARKDARWLKRTHGADIRRGQFMSQIDQKVLNTATKTIKSDVKELNKRPEYSGIKNKIQLKRSSSELAQRYEKDHTDLFIKHMKAAAVKHQAVSPSGKWEHHLNIGKTGNWFIGIKRTQMAHAAWDDMDVVCAVHPIREDGHIVGHEPVEDSMTQSEAFIEDILSHHGVLGMKWGHRKDRISGTPTEAHVRQIVNANRFSKTKIKTAGGENHPASADALRVAGHRQVLKRSGTHALSNDELKDLANRMQLEQQVHQLIKRQPKGLGEAFVNQQLSKAVSDPIGTYSKGERVAKTFKTGGKAAGVAAGLAALV